MNTPFYAHVLKRFELYATALTVVFITIAGGLVWADASAAVVFATTAIGMALIQGAIQWVDRERQRRLRAQAIAEIREMLTDQVFNQLAAIRMWITEDPDPVALGNLIEETDESIGRVAMMINGLSEEQLNTWKLTYANVADEIAFPARMMAEA